jgi:hypothetical protein
MILPYSEEKQIWGIVMKTLLHDSLTMTFLLTVLWMIYLIFINSIFSVGCFIVVPYLIGFIRIWILFFDRLQLEEVK